MKRLAMASVVLAIAGVGATVVTTPAQAQTGFLCGFTSEYDPTLEGDTQTGEIDGGPLFAADVDNPGEETARITITCTIQVGAGGDTHAGADAVSRSATGDGVAVLPPTVISYGSPHGSPVYLCTQATIDIDGAGPTAPVTRYYDSADDTDPADVTGWSDSNGVDCGLAVYQDLLISARCGGDIRFLCRMPAPDNRLCILWVAALGGCVIGPI